MEDSAEVTVTGTSLKISDVDLCLGTGPLVDFGRRNERPDLSAIVTTTLTNSTILNTTSSSAPHPFAPHPTISQSVIGCLIAESTNHFAGTATLNVNHVQHFSALNTTVMACHDTLRSNDDVSNKNYSTRPSFCSSTTGITRCLFKGCFSTYSEGAAISLDSSNSVAIAECSFADCFCSSASTGIGGAVCVDEHSSYFSDGPQTTITKSSVANCRAHWGSGVCLRNHRTVTISEFVVENCSELEAGLSSKKTGLGALLISNTDESVSVSNSLFSHCHNDHAGSIFLNGSLLQNTFNYLAFRGSSVEKQDESRDFATTLHSSTDLALMFSDFDSTSFGDAEPFVAIGTTDSSGNLTIRKSVADLIVPQQFRHSASTSVAYGATGILQPSLGEYLVTGAAMKGWRMTPSVSIAKCALSSTGNEIDVTIHGTNFEDGTYEVELKKTSDGSTTVLNFERRFERLYKSAVAYPESSAELEYNTQYTLVSVTWDGKLLDRSVEASIFTTPVTPARLIGIEEVVFTEGKKAERLPFISSGLSPSTTYTMVVDSIPKGTDASHNRTLNLTTDSSGSLIESVQTVYPQKYSLLSFGTDYKVCTFALSSGTTFIALNSITFTVPDEPSRLKNVAISYESNGTVAVLTISGRVLSQQDHTLLLMNTADETDTPTIPIVYSSPESGSWSATFSLVDAPLLKYGQTYTVTALKVGGEDGADVLVYGTLAVAVAEPAVINDLSFEFDEGTQSTGKLVFSTIGMPISTDLVVTVKGESTFNLTGFLTFSTAESGSIAVTLFSASKAVQLEYGKTYTITKIVEASSSTEVLIAGDRDFTIPQADPRVISLRASKWLDDGRGMTYSFYSVGLEDEEHEMELTCTTGGADREPVAKMTLSVVDTTTLKYSHSYKVTKITRKSKPTEGILADTITLSVAAQQTSLTTVSCAMQAGSFEKNVSISYEGVGSFNSYFYPVFENEGVFIEPSSLIFSGTKATHSIQIFGSSSSPKLEYGRTFSLVRVRAYSSSVVPLLLTKTFQIDIPAEKPRVTSHGSGLYDMIVPRSASRGDKKGLVSVYEASLTLNNLTVSVSGSTSVTCLVFGMGSTFNVEQCTVFVEKIELVQELNTNAVVCSWTTGLFMLETSIISFISSSFEDIEQGVVDMDGGSLLVQNCEFHKNGKVFDNFPSMRQNIECRNEATIEITTAEPSDEPFWIAADNCQVLKKLDRSKGFDENDKFVVSMKGTHLIPCGLKLEIYEVFPKNKTATGKGTIIELTEANTANWTETGFVATIFHSQLKPDLDVNHDWHMALNYGQDERSSATMKFKDRTKKAAATVAIVVPTVVFVLVCVVVGCIVGCVCVRRRTVQHNKYKQYQNKSSVIRTPSQGDLTEGDDVLKYGGMNEDEFF
ncbi:hypothetical protein BLNAU_16501 [Blattamonas nauphoetae]|uniref:Uncharacterized protein n=1 Tax=Blattamonas nauphoetae TaxID=2049346 RepID=A0ABQ9XBE8_9EUKA|nr:hypothetical protein BLNAU_16501 [Blattamonas nauphoetae]